MSNRLGMALVASLCDSAPSTFEEASQHHVWRDAMMEENGVQEIVPRPEGEVNGDFSMALQGRACCRWQCGEIQRSVFGLGVFIGRGS